MKSFTVTQYKNGRVITQTEDDEFTTIGKNPTAHFRYFKNGEYWTWDQFTWEKAHDQYERQQRVNRATGQVDSYHCGEYDII